MRQLSVHEGRRRGTISDDATSSISSAIHEPGQLDFTVINRSPCHDKVTQRLCQLTCCATFTPKRQHEELLSFSHAVLRPRTYLEIGVNKGRSLALSLPGTKSVGVDPKPNVKYPLGGHSVVVSATSDDFFGSGAPDRIFRDPVDLAFIDGMHLFEYALRDFRNTEKVCHSSSTLIVDDCLPESIQQADRQGSHSLWTGDVWKLLLCLKEFRPDLQVTIVDTHPAGVAIVRNLTPDSRVLFDEEDRIIQFVANRQFPGRGFFEYEFAVVDYNCRSLREVLREGGSSSFEWRDVFRLGARYSRLTFGSTRLGRVAARGVRRAITP